MPTKNLTNETAIFGLWLNWVLAGGALTLPSVLSVYMPAVALPAVCLLLAGALLLCDRHSVRTGTAVCPLVPAIAERSLFYTSIIMMAIAVAYKKGYIEYFFDSSTLNHAIPFVTLLVLAPVVLCCSVWSIIRGKDYAACQRCEVVMGPVSERGFLGRIFAQESHYQRLFLGSISAVLTIVSWGYYLLWYSNASINEPDRFFFGWISAILYGLSVIYLAARCFTLWAYYCQDIEGSERRHGSSSTLRVIVINDGRIWLHRDLSTLADHPDAHLADTPATVTIRLVEQMPLPKAKAFFSDLSGQPDVDFDMRFLYKSTDATGLRNTFHFVATTADAESMEWAGTRGEWFTMAQLEDMLHRRELAPALAAEIKRIFTVARAWKTYDSEGRRLYKVRNYSPLVRLGDIMDWDVDFDSLHWLKVARLNQDKPLWRLRRLWRRLYATEGSKY